MSEKKSEKIELGIYRVRDVCEYHRDGQVTKEEDLPICEISGRVEKRGKLVTLLQCHYLDCEMAPGQDTRSSFKGNWVSSAIVIKLKMKEAFPEKGTKVVTVEI